MPFLPDFDAATFIPGAAIDNPFFPLTPGTVLSYSGTKVDEDSGEEETESNDVLVSSETKLIEGVQAVVVRDTAYEDGVLVEDTLDWYAQDTDGNVWYLGEIAYNYNFDDDGNYSDTDNDGSWEAGVDGALPGWIMPADSEFPESYYQEFYAGEAEDEGLILGNDEEVSIDFGDFDGVLKTQDTTALEPDVREFKYYAPNVGQVLGEEGLDEDDVPELSIELTGIRQIGGEAVGEEVEHPEAEDFEGEGEEVYVTFLGAETDQENALGAYTFDLETGEIGEGQILFESSEDLEVGDSVAVEVEEGEGLGLFLISDVEEFALDLSEFEEGGLYFRNILTNEAATLGDSLAPLVTDEDGMALPIHTFHALGGEDGFNLLNPAGGAQATELEPLCQGIDEDEDDEISVVGFEERRVTEEEFDGDYNDLIVAVSDDEVEDFLDPEDVIMGSADADRLVGSRSEDIILGEAGDDILLGRRGDDQLCGGADDDLLSGGRGDDELIGGSGMDSLRGGRGEDELDGGAGNDSLLGGRGDDELDGGSGEDTLRGGRGDDVLEGDQGDDLLFGGRGEDTFVFELDDGDDTVGDFDADEELIDISETALTFEDLTIGAAGGGSDTQIDLGTGSILLVGVTLAEIGETSFIV